MSVRHLDRPLVYDGINPPSMELRADTLRPTPADGVARVLDAANRQRVAREQARARPDPMAAPHVDVRTPCFGGSIRLHSASGGRESLWIRLRDEDGAEVIFDRATQTYMQPALRLTPRDARALSDLLRRYADTHRETEE